MTSQLGPQSPGTKYLSKLAGKTVLIFGGTSGIGHCIAEACLEHSANVVVSGSSDASVERAISRLHTAYPHVAGSSQQIRGYACDLSDHANLDANLVSLLEKATEGKKLTIDHVAFTAGDSVGIQPLEKLDLAGMKTLGNVRFYGVAFLAKHLPTYMSPGPGSSLTMTSGSVTSKPMPGLALMAGWGAALEGLMRGLAVDLKPLRVNIVSPGAVHTELFDRFAEHGNLEDVLKAWSAATTTGEIGRPEDVAEAYVYLMKNRFASGSVVNSDGGRLLA